MHKIVPWIIVLLFTGTHAMPLFAKDADVVSDLLELFLIPPGAPDQAQKAFKIRQSNVPADDAPIEELMEYWMRISETKAADPRLSERVRERLLDAAEANPERLIELLAFLPLNEASHDRIKKILDAENTKFPSERGKQIRAYLMFNSRYFRAELIQGAQKAQDFELGAFVSGGENLVALANLDWSQAEPILLQFSEGKQPRVAALALGLLYIHANAQVLSSTSTYRERLQSIVRDIKAPGYARDRAFTELMQTEWKGRDE
jgi:hypothetical protein